MIERILTGVFVIFFVMNGYGQDAKVIDSLNLALEQIRGGDRYPALHMLAVEYFDVDNEIALDVIIDAERAALLSGDSVWIVKSKRAKAQILSRLGRLDEVLAINEFTYRIAKRGRLVEECMLITNISGCVFLLKSRFDKALKYFFQSYEMGIEQNDSSGIATALENIGITYYKLCDYKKALHYLERSFEVKKALGTVGFLTHMNMSLCYVYLGEFSKARAYLDASLNSCAPGCGDYRMTHIKFTMGSIFLGLEKYDSAEIEFLTSYSLAKSLANTRMQLDNICLLSEIYMKQNRLHEAAQFLKEGEKVTRQAIPFNMEIIKIYFRLSELFYSLNNFEKAATYQKKYISLKDSIYNDALTTSLMKIESQFLERENHAKIAEQDEVILLKEKVISHQKLLILITGILVLTILTFFGFLLKSYGRKKNLNRLLESKVRERTSDLETSRDALLKAIKEKNLKIGRVSREIKETINTVDGLCVTGIREVSEPVAHTYLERIHRTVQRLTGNYQSLFAGSDLKRES